MVGEVLGVRWGSEGAGGPEGEFDGGIPRLRSAQLGRRDISLAWGCRPMAQHSQAPPGERAPRAVLVNVRPRCSQEYKKTPFSFLLFII